MKSTKVKQQQGEAVPYNCDPAANKRAMIWVNELTRRGRLVGTREQVIVSLMRALDSSLMKAQKKRVG
jgi:hypothetical protein